MLSGASGSQVQQGGVAMAVYHLTATVWQEGDQYVSRCPELGVASCGDTPDQALNELQEAVELYLENAKMLDLLPDLEATLSAPHRFCSAIEVSVP
jgi:predicted RNase H-like HicB family nuclease